MRHHFILAQFFQAYDELTPTHIGGDLHLLYSNVSSLGNLEYVAGTLDIGRTTIFSFGKLEYVGGFVYCDEGEQFHKLQSKNNRCFRMMCF